MTPVSQIVWKNQHRFRRDKPLLLVFPPDDELAGLLREERLIVECINQSWTIHQYHQKRGTDSHFRITPDSSRQWEQILLFQPREKPLLEMMLKVCGERLTTDGSLWLAGANRVGIKSAAKRLEHIFGTHQKIDSARHCSIYQARHPADSSLARLQSFEESWQFETNEQRVTIASYPGVFAHGHLDPGSKLLIDTLTEPGDNRVSGRVLDFACGAGQIGIALKLNEPSIELTLIDDSALAIRAARHSLEINQVNATLFASNGLEELQKRPKPQYDWIVSNPPFHTGVDQNLDITRLMMSESRNYLVPGAKMCLVANVHLPYGRWLEELFNSVKVIATDRGYNIWLATNAT